MDVRIQSRVCWQKEFFLTEVYAYRLRRHPSRLQHPVDAGDPDPELGRDPFPRHPFAKNFNKYGLAAFAEKSRSLH